MCGWGGWWGSLHPMPPAPLSCSPPPPPQRGLRADLRPGEQQGAQEQPAGKGGREGGAVETPQTAFKCVTRVKAYFVFIFLLHFYAAHVPYKVTFGGCDGKETTSRDSWAPG